MTESTIPDAAVPPVDAPVVPAPPADFTAAAQPVDPTRTKPVKYLTNPVKQQTVEVLQYIAPDGLQAGNIPDMQAFVGPDHVVKPQVSFNVSTGQTALFIDDTLVLPGSFVLKTAEAGIEIFADEDALSQLYTQK
jgi:hypothetical protein